MNSNIKEYLKVLEEECGENKCQEATHVDEKRMDIMINPSYARVSGVAAFGSDYKWGFKNRCRIMKETFHMYRSILSKYKPFDFRTYEVEYNPYGFDIYAKIFKTSTPWKRFKGFMQEVKNMIIYCKDSFFFVPTPVQHYQANKKRIGWFEKNIWSWFSGTKKEKEMFENKLKSFGYTISEDKHYIYYDQKSSK